MKGILLFTKSPNDIESKSRLRKEIDNSTVDKLSLTIFSHLLKEISPHNLCISFKSKPARNIIPKDQKNTNIFFPVQSGFKKQLKESIDYCFNTLKFSSLIIIGSDCPFIDSNLINSTFKILDNKTPVLGPTQDSGFYLLGINKADNNSNFLDCLESENQVKFLMDTFINIKLLDTQTDFDYKSDIINSKYNPKLCKNIKKIIDSIEN